MASGGKGSKVAKNHVNYKRPHLCCTNKSRALHKSYCLTHQRLRSTLHGALLATLFNVDPDGALRETLTYCCAFPQQLSSVLDIHLADKVRRLYRLYCALASRVVSLTTTTVRSRKLNNNDFGAFLFQSRTNFSHLSTRFD